MPGGGTTFGGDGGPKVVSGPDGGGATVPDDGKEAGPDVMEETKAVAADEIMAAMKSGDSGALKAALTEFVYACK